MLKTGTRRQYRSINTGVFVRHYHGQTRQLSRERSHNDSVASADYIFTNTLITASNTGKQQYLIAERHAVNNCVVIRWRMFVNVNMFIVWQIT